MSGRRFVLAAIPIAGFAALVSLACGAPGALDSATPQETRREAPSSSDHVWLEVSWAMGYGDIPSLMADADLVALGEIVGYPSVVSEQVGAPPAAGTLYSSYYSFKIERVLYGAAGQSAVVVVQTGGTVNGKTREISDDPLTRLGDRYVLFLKEGTPGLFFVLGGPQGRFVVRDGVVSSLSAVYPERNIFDLGIRDVPLGAFVEQIRQ